MSPEKTGRWPLIGGVVAAITASLCCIGPLVLVMLGIGGSWIANLSALEPFRPYFLGVSVIFLFFAWKKFTATPLRLARLGLYASCRRPAAFTNCCSGWQQC